MLKTMHLDSMF